MSLENSQMQQPADLGSEASFGQENISRDLPHDPNDIQSYLRSLKEKHMVQIERVFQNHHQRLEDSEREISNSMREIQIQQIKRKQQQEEYLQQAEKARQEEDNLRRILSIKPQTVEEIKEKVKLQMQLQQKVSSQQNISFSQNQMHQLSQQASKSPQSNVNRKTPISNKSAGGGKKKGTLWFYENREKAEYEYALRDYLREKEKKKSITPATPKTFQPIIIRPEERKLYDKVKENEDYEIMTPCSDDLSNYAFETGNDIMANFQSIFENSDKQSKKQKKRYRVKDFKDDELFLIAYFFSKIPQHTVEGDDEEGDFVTKEDFEQALMNKREILLLYNIKPEDLHKELLRLSTKKAGYVSLKEAGEFLMRDRQSLSMEHYENIQKLKQDERKETLTVAQSLLTEEQVNILRDIFLDIDTFGECKVSLKQMISKVKTDHRTRDWIEKPIAFIKQVDRTILMEDLFSELEQWMSLGKEAERRQKEYVDWDTIKELFVNYKRKDIPSRDKVFAAQRLLGRYDFGDTIEIPKDFLQVIKSTFENLPKYAQYYVNTNDFIEELINNKQYTFFKTKFVRSKKYIDLEIETVDDVLKRMSQECDIYHTQDEILDFFSRKGRPRYLARRIKQQKHKKILMKKVEKQEVQENQKEESDDSFEIDRSEIREKRKQRKVAKILQGTEEDVQKQLEKNQFMQQKNFGAQFKSEDDDFIITVPQPFRFDSRDKQKQKSIRQRRLEEMLQEKQDIEDYYVSTATAFRANKIPNHIKDRHLWEKIQQKNEQRRQIVKKESKAMTLARENPFTFYYRDLQKVMERKNFQPEYKFTHFKAKHAPWYCRVRLFDRLMEKQREKSRQNVEKRKAELMKGSKLPEGVKSMLQRLKVKDQITEEKRRNRLLEYSFQPPRAKSVPDFATLQKDFEEKLSQKKGEFQPTIPAPFNFQETRKAPKRDYLDKENELVKKTKEASQQVVREKKLKRILTMKVKYQPPSTKKFEALVAKKRFEQEVRQYQKEVTQSREQDKNERRKKFAEFVNSCINNVNYSEYANQLRQQKYQERENRMIEKIQWEQQFDQKMTEMMQNVIRRPLLIEQVSQSAFTSGRAQRLRQILGEGAPIQEESEHYEDEDELIIPNFDQMTQAQLYNYLDPSQVHPQTLEIRKQLYTQYIQKKQMPNINEMDEEDEDQHTYQNNQEEYEHEGEEINPQGQHEDEEERDNEAVNKMNQQYQIQEEYQQYSKDAQHEAGEDDEEDDFHNNQELIEQQKQVQQIQQQQMDDDEDEDYEIDAGGQPGSSDDYEKIYPQYQQQQKLQQQQQQQQQQAQKGSKNASVDIKQQQQSNSFNKVNQSNSSSKAASNQASGIPQQNAGYPQLNNKNQNEDEDEEDFDEDQEQIYDENGQPIPPELLKEYQEQIRRMQEQGDYDEEYDEDDDDDEYDENAQYFDENGKLIPIELVKQIKEERKAQKQLQQQAYAAGSDQQKGKSSPGDTDSKRSSQQPSVSKQQQAQQQPQQARAEEQSAGKPAAAPSQPPQQQQQNNQPSQKDQAKNQNNNQIKLNEQDYDDDEQINEEDLLDQDAQYVDEDGNPLSAEQVAQYLKHQKMQQAMEDDPQDAEYYDEDGNLLTPEEVAEFMRQQKLMAQQDQMGMHDPDDPEEAEYIDEDGNPLTREEVAEILREQKMRGMQHANEEGEHEDFDENHGDSKNDKQREYDDEEFDEDEEEYVDQHGNPIDPEKIKQLKQQEAAAAATANLVQKQTQPQSESKEKPQENKSIPEKDQQKGATKLQNVEKDDEEYGEYDDEDQFEQQFESEEEYINYLVQTELKKQLAAGKKVTEQEIRQMIEEQIMMEQQEHDQMEAMDEEQIEAMDEQLEEIIAQMSPEDLANFVDDNGQTLPKDQIKYILMQQHLQGYDDEDEEEEYQQQMQMRAAQQKGGSQKDAHNSSF
ncbi:hypothetical protein TTHERM_00305630 (macronuclear) [Tetrahymena thermophila SB210]|uniref:Uncharacterized protein n=1 Tax=Tetrahymena thermophila (strain SB210) TaxID=312017 RepID=I7ML02_TETTS|nr:hypothetical protein TTHERM_00305630 [Tetrahymena thermophila SB210]EAS00790.2 hypothetical protein TTHERM_00305630 [Tetrahymena thermophila SB210]|eukprot:XP_001021035.2 hypothetical protein TTHERM_00305630 [Tetrahymena thermophila SB210]